MSQNNERILKCQTKSKRKKKELEIAIYPGNQTKYSLVWKCQTTQFITQLFLLWNYYYCATPMEKGFIQCAKIYLKSQYSKSKALNLIPDH